MKKRSCYEEELCGYAAQLGADAAVWLAAAELVIEDRFVELCKEGCPSYGLSPGCPPNAITPDQFRTMVKGYADVIVFRIDAPAEDLLGAQRLVVAKRVHYVSALVERKARDLGFCKSSGFAAGSCWELFCAEEPCPVLACGFACRFQDLVRPSISALGVNVEKLCESVGWELRWSKGAEEGIAMGMMIGMVLIG